MRIRFSGWAKIFERRHSEGETSRSTATLKEKQEVGFEDIFDQAEESWVHHFESTCRKQELAFAKAQDSRQEGEAMRSGQFEVFLAKISQRFSSDLQVYRRSLLEAEERQEQEYQVAEDRRDQIFEKSHDRREKIFESSVKEQKHQSERSASIREQLIEREREQREVRYKALLVLIQGQFEELVRSAKADFIVAQTQRKEKIKDANTSGVPQFQASVPSNDASGVAPLPSVPNGRRSPQGLLFPLRKVTSNRTTTPVPPNIRIRRSVSPDSVRSHSELICHYPGRIPCRSRSRSPRRHRTPSPTIQPPLPLSTLYNTPANPIMPVVSGDSEITSSEFVPSESPVMKRPLYDTVFFQGQKTRQKMFDESQRGRELSFNKVEEQLNQTNDLRDSAFSDKVQELETEFGDVTRAFEKRYEQTRERRQDRAALRCRMFEEVEEGFSSLFEQLLSSIEDEYQALNKAEEHIIDFWEAQITLTLDNMDADIRKISSRHRQLFLTLTDGLDQSSLTTPLSPTYSPTFDLMRSPVPSEPERDSIRFKRRCRRRSVSSSRSDERRFRWRPTGRSGGSQSYRIPAVVAVPHVIQAMPPDVEPSFVPQTLFKREILTSTLPVSEKRPSNTPRTVVFSSLREYQLIYDKSYKQRQRTFERALERFRQIHAINELRRRASYNENQHKWEDDAASRTAARVAEAGNQLLLRECTFQLDEGSRTRQFQRRQEENSSQFNAAQHRRRKCFREEEGRLQVRLKEDELHRQQRFVKWEFFVRQEIANKVESWRKLLEEELQQQDWILTTLLNECH